MSNKIQITGMKLSFGTEQIGRSSVVLQFTNEWLTMHIYIAADRGTTYIDCYDCEHAKFFATIDDEADERINKIDYESIEEFNNCVKPILYKFFKNTFRNNEYHKGELSGFSLTGLRLDLD